MASRRDMDILQLQPLQLHPRGMLNLRGHYEDDMWALMQEEPGCQDILARGNCLSFEMERIPFGYPRKPLRPLTIDELYAGDDGAYDYEFGLDIEKELYEASINDLRCLDVHERLGWRRGIRMQWLEELHFAQRHFEMGIAIAELTVPADFGAAIPWQYPGNRPFLHCLQGLGLVYWYRGEFSKAHEIFSRILWLDPFDALGARFILGELAEGLSFRNAISRFVLGIR